MIIQHIQHHPHPLAALATSPCGFFLSTILVDANVVIPGGLSSHLMSGSLAVLGTCGVLGL